MEKITLEIAKKLIEAAEQKAADIGVPMVISIVDDGGNLIACHRMDDALLVSLDISQNKAWTSVAMKMTTETLAKATGGGDELFGINTTNNGRVVIFGGGIPLYANDSIVGAIGVSGGSVNADIQVAQAGADALKDSNLLTKL